jgi:hypothetical protein
VRKQSLLVAAASLLVSCGVASAQNQTSQDQRSGPTTPQNTPPDKPAIATVPEAATDTPGVLTPQTTGQGPKRIQENGC